MGFLVPNAVYPLAGTGLITKLHINGLVQDCSNSIANALELLWSCTKQSMFFKVSLGYRNLDIFLAHQSIFFEMTNQFL